VQVFAPGQIEFLPAGVGARRAADQLSGELACSSSAHNFEIEPFMDDQENDSVSRAARFMGGAIRVSETTGPSVAVIWN